MTVAKKTEEKGCRKPKEKDGQRLKVTQREGGTETAGNPRRRRDRD